MDESPISSIVQLCSSRQQPMVIIAHILPGWKRGAVWQPVQSRAPPGAAKGAPSP